MLEKQQRLSKKEKKAVAANLASEAMCDVVEHIVDARLKEDRLSSKERDSQKDYDHHSPKALSADLKKKSPSNANNPNPEEGHELQHVEKLSASHQAAVQNTSARDGQNRGSWSTGELSPLRKTVSLWRKSVSDGSEGSPSLTSATTEEEDRLNKREDEAGGSGSVQTLGSTTSVNEGTSKEEVTAGDTNAQGAPPASPLSSSAVTKERDKGAGKEGGAGTRPRSKAASRLQCSPLLHRDECLEILEKNGDEVAWTETEEVCAECFAHQRLLLHVAEQRQHLQQLALEALKKPKQVPDNLRHWTARGSWNEFDDDE